MSIGFKDFTYKGKTLSALNYIIVDINNISEDSSLAMTRSLVEGEKNKYRDNANEYDITFDDKLTLKLGIIKNVCNTETLGNQDISRDEFREISKWLTSDNTTQWLKCTYNTGTPNLAYKGFFSNIEPYIFGGRLNGLTLTFTCKNSFAYTDNIKVEKTVSELTQISINNDSDSLNSYCYPSITISPLATEQIYFCNLSDSKILDSGRITVGATNSDTFANLITKVNDYGLAQGLTIHYLYKNDSIVSIGNETCVQFTTVDIYDNTTKCFAFYDKVGIYKIVHNGLMYFNVYKDLPVNMDCQNLTLRDDIGRPILYSKLGISDVDSIYWFRLVSGNNDVVLFGTNCKFTFTYKEARKVGAL